MYAYALLVQATIDDMHAGMARDLFTLADRALDSDDGEARAAGATIISLFAGHSEFEWLLTPTVKSRMVVAASTITFDRVLAPVPAA